MRVRTARFRTSAERMRFTAVGALLFLASARHGEGLLFRATVVRENAPLVPADLENVRPKLALGYLREVLDLPREFPVQVRRLKACGGTERERG